MKLEAGMLAKSKAGRDKDQVYVIIDADREYVYVADGDFRPLRHMKRKNRRHLQPIRKVRMCGQPDDAAIRQVISNYTQSRETAYESPAESAGTQED